MSRLDGIEKQKRDNAIRTLYSQGMTQKEIGKKMGIGQNTVSRILCASVEPITIIRNTYELYEQPKQNPFRANLQVGQVVTLYDITLDNNRNPVIKGSQIFEVAGRYTWHVRFERPGSNGNVITVDYVWADLRHRLKMKGGRVA